MTEAFVNRVATAVPQHEVHGFFVRFAHGQLAGDPRRQKLFARMVERGGIEERYCCFAPAPTPDGASIDRDGLFRRGAFAGTGERMRLYERHAPELAARAVEGLELGAERRTVTHLIVTSCTGFVAPGIDLAVIARCGLPAGVERTVIGFMGCYAAVNALKLARHIVRSEPRARVLVVNIELCTIHIKETSDVEELLTFFLWGDGCAAALVTADPTGFRLDGFQAVLAPGTDELMTWSVRDQGFDMVLSGRVPATVRSSLEANRAAILRGRAPSEIGMWAVHPGGRSVLDAVGQAFGLGDGALDAARSVLRRYGNMSSATIAFVMAELMAAPGGALGCGMAFGPGLVAETFTFSEAAGRPAWG